MPTLKEIYRKFYKDLMIMLQVQDPMFNAELYSADLFPGNTRAAVLNMSTAAQATMYFLDNVIDRGWNGDNSNSRFEDLLTSMEKCDDSTVNSLASDIKKSNHLVYPSYMYERCTKYRIRMWHFSQIGNHNKHSDHS